MLSNPARLPIRLFPWVALILLLSASAVLGLFLAKLPNTWISWNMAIFGVLLVAIVSTHPHLDIGRWLSSKLQSDVFTFTLLAIIAALVSIILLWLHIFLKIVAVFSAIALVRLELHQNGFSTVQSFWILMITSFTGLGLGWLVSNSI
jgi:hypothetical protein